MSKLHQATWSSVKSKVSKANPDLFRIIEAIDSECKHPLYLVKYKYGQNLIEDGIFQVPINGNNKHVSLDKTQYAHELGYNDMNHPVFLVLSGCVETSILLKPRSIPFGISSKGKVVGLWKTLDNKAGFSHCLNLPNWRVTAGAKSVFMLPRINESRGHHRLEVEYGKSIHKPKDHSEHCLTFADIASDEWECELLLFSKSWFDEINNHIWASFYNYLLDTSWVASGFWRNSFTWEIAFNQIDIDCGIKVSRHIFDIVKHLLITSMGIFPGFVPALNNDLGPISSVQEAYASIYKLKYAPVVLVPAYLNIEAGSPPVYFSLQCNTALELAAKAASKTTNIEELYQVYLLLEKYLRALVGDKYLKTPVSQLESTNFDFFHRSPSDYRGFNTVDTLFSRDERFKEIEAAFPGCKLPHAAGFFSGCVRISKNI